MAANPDPKPGRWILPLVILGMIAFTYFFVSELPEASTDTTPPVAGDTTTTTVANGDANGDDNGDDTPPTNDDQSPLDPNIQAYLNEIDDINTELQGLRTELTATNTGFDADPREIEFSETLSRFEAAESATEELADRQSDLTPPAGLEGNHLNLQTAVDLASASITEAIAGLRSDDPGDRRRAAISAYANAAADYDTEVANTHNAARAAAG